MDLTLQSKACLACARAKRRCSKQIPTCGRCQSRGISCDYPLTHHTFSLPPRQNQVSSTHRVSTPDMAVAPTVTRLDMLFDTPGDAMAIDHLYHFNFDSGATLFNPNDDVHLHSKDISLPWYLEASSWELDQGPDPVGLPIYSSTVLLDHVEALKNWQAQWVRTGSSPYIHPNVYRFQMPRCVQDAYTTLSTYLERTPANKALVARIVEDRVRQLLNDPPQCTEMLEHLARVHALHIYQAIGLYDGDIRLRHVAETQIPTMNSWVRQLMHLAKAAAAQGVQDFIQPVIQPPEGSKRSSLTCSSRSDNNNNNNEAVIAMTARLSREESEWYAWSLAETIRRTWTVVTAVQTVYLTLQVGHAPCPGGSMYTAREGLWDAKTASAWASKCGESSVDFVNRTQWSGVFESRRPEEMDEFSREVLQITYGSERVEWWKNNINKQ